MRAEDALDRHFGGIELGRGTAKSLHRAANRWDALTFSLRKLQAIEEPRQALIAPARGYSPVFEIVEFDSKRQGARRGKFNSVSE